MITLPYYCPGGKNEKIKTIRFLGSVRSLFYQNTSSARKRTLLLQRKYGKLQFRGEP